MTFSTGLLTLVGAFMGDALWGARYLQTRSDAQTVWTFPWALSRYTERYFRASTEPWLTDEERAPRTAARAVRTGVLTVRSYAVRLVMAFHPMAYLLLWDWGGPEPWYLVGYLGAPAPWHYKVLGIVLFGLCTWIFLHSQQFQKPIVFDRPTERERKSDAEELTQVVKRLDQKLGALVEEHSAEEGSNS